MVSEIQTPSTLPTNIHLRPYHACICQPLIHGQLSFFNPKLSGSVRQHLSLPTFMEKSKRNPTVSTPMLHVLEPTRHVGNAAQAKAEAAQECSSTNFEALAARPSND